MGVGLVLDAGALIGVERGDRRAVAVVARAVERGAELHVPAAVVAQVWRDGRRQVRLARLLAAPQCRVVPLDDLTARAAGQLCGASGTADIADAAVVALARRLGQPVATCDADDVRRLDPKVRLVSV